MTELTGIFGCSGSGRRLGEFLYAAREVAAFRGEPVGWRVGEGILGGWSANGGASVQEGPAVVHARVDAVREGGVWREVSEGGERLLIDALGKVAPLADLAADFAIAHLDPRTGSLILARDCFGLRPVFWAQHRDSVVFSSEQEMLSRLIGNPGYDVKVVSAYLAGHDFGGSQTAFSGVRRLLGGCLLRKDCGARAVVARWSTLGSLSQESPDDPVQAITEAIVAAVGSRTFARRPALALSAGRDSGAIAAAAARVGGRLDCFTYDFESEPERKEVAPARQLAEAFGHRWTAAEVPERVDEEQFANCVEGSGTPCGICIPQHVPAMESAREAGADSWMDGEGGDWLFDLPPVALRDLLREGRLRPAVRAARALPDHRTNYIDIARAVLRPMFPARSTPLEKTYPRWVRPPRPVEVWPALARSSRTLDRLMVEGAINPFTELWERQARLHGLEYTCPLLDRRLVSLVLSSSSEVRLPGLQRKPLLAPLLGAHEADRMKMTFEAYYMRYADQATSVLPSAARHATFAYREGWVDAIRPRDAKPTFLGLRLIAVETWLSARTTGG